MEWPNYRFHKKQFKKGIYIINDYHRRFDALEVRYIVSIDNETVKKKNIDYTASYLSEILKSKYETVKKALDFFFMLDILERDIKEI